VTSACTVQRCDRGSNPVEALLELRCLLAQCLNNIHESSQRMISNEGRGYRQMISIDAKRYQGDRTKIKVDKFPDTCSLCHRGIDARFSELAHFIAGANGRVELIFQCPLENCQSFFIARYYRNIYGDGFRYSHSAPLEPRRHEFSESIKKISPFRGSQTPRGMNNTKRIPVHL
jgi:hypothetical protein